MASSNRYIEDKTKAYSKSIPSSVDFGRIKKLGGNTIGFNQLAQNGNCTSITGWSAVGGTLSISNNELSYTVTSVQTQEFDNYIEYTFSDKLIPGHRYFISFEMLVPHQNSRSYTLYWCNSGQIIDSILGVRRPPANEWYRQVCFTNDLSPDDSPFSTTMESIRLYGLCYNDDGYEVGDVIKIRNLYVIDISNAFGQNNHRPLTEKACADIFTNSYYNYNPIGELCSACVNKIQVGSEEISIPASVMALEGYGCGITPNNYFYSDPSIYNYIEWVDGKVYYHKRVIRYNLGDFTYTRTQNSSGNYVFRATGLRNIAKRGTTNIICSRYSPHYYYNANESDLSVSIGNTSLTYLFIRDDSYTDAATFKTAMNGVYIEFELATEVVTDITNLFDSHFDYFQVDGAETITFKNSLDQIFLPIDNTLHYYNDITYISSITLPDGSTYDIKTTGYDGIITVKGTQTTTTASWTGDISIPELYDGLTIAYYLPTTSASNVTLNLSLYDGTSTGDIPVYVTSTTRMGTHYAAGSTIILTYWSAGSISVNGTVTTEDRWTSAKVDVATATTSTLGVVKPDGTSITIDSNGVISSSGGGGGSGAVYIEGTQQSSTASWTGSTTEITSLDTGMEILYRLPYASAANATLELTLSGGTSTGAIPVFFTNTTRVGTQYGANSVVALVYDATYSSNNNNPAWVVLNPYSEHIIEVQDTQPTSDALVWIDTDAEGADFCFVGPNAPPADGSVTVWIDTSEDEIPIQQGAAGVKYNNTQSGLEATTVQGAIDEIVNIIYPIGSVYISVNNVSPATLFGGTWEQIKDTFLLSAGDTYTAGDTGGSADAVVVEHMHNRICYYGNSEWSIGDQTGLGGTETDAHSVRFAYGSTAETTMSHWRTTNAGVSGVGKNMPPYLTVYMWKRTA